MDEAFDTAGSDALIHRIGHLIVSDASVRAAQWDRYALVASYGDRTLRLSGFAYTADGGYAPATPDRAELLDAIGALRDATRVAGEAPWQAAVFRIVRDGGRIHVEFEYDAPGRWEITPRTLADVARRARPA